jgi:DNA-binding SARP family transcriptional activator
MEGRCERKALRFSVLGPVSVSDGERTVMLQPSKPVCLLAAMLLRPNRMLSVEFLQNAVWDDRATDTSKATLQTYVLRLRRIFREFGMGVDVIETVPGGYRLPAGPDALDLVEFRSLAAAASSCGGPDEELRLLTRALDLWQGAPLANIPSEFLHRDEVPRLTEEWLCVAERRFDLELALGRHRDVVAELTSVTRAYPSCEPFRAQLMEALYRSGRQADALFEYHDVKRYLDRELGIDPGQRLRQLEMAILRGEELAQRPMAEARMLTGEFR